MPSPYRLGVVSYLNARPLIQGLEGADDIRLIFDVPARLPALLDEGSVDAALVPVVDFLQPDRSWKIVSDACIGCDGETLTVRVFSRVPAREVTHLHVDGDSHASVALARILWREMFGARLAMSPWSETEDDGPCQAVLLIGDKVVTRKPIDFEIETDLGLAWKSLTGLPFVFAAWAAPASADVGLLAPRLAAARDAGVRCARMIAEDVGPGMGWPAAVARRYLTSRLTFTLTERHRAGMARFLDLARKYDIVSPKQELVFAV